MPRASSAWASSMDDLVAAKLWLFDHPRISGIFNLGTGRAQNFNAVARAVIIPARRID